MFSGHEVRRPLLDFRYRPHSGAAFRRVTLGRYPALSLVEARAAAERIRDQVRTGADPQQEKRDDREALRAAPEELTFDALADLYIERYAKRQKASWKNDEGYLRANARPAWGKRSAASITSQDAARLLFEVVDVRADLGQPIALGTGEAVRLGLRERPAREQPNARRQESPTVKARAKPGP